MMLPFTVDNEHRTAILAPDRPNLVYGELSALIASVGRQLRAAGISREDRVAFIAPNGPEAATGFLAIAGVCQCAPLNPGYRGTELAYYLDDLKPALIVHAGALPASAVNAGIRTVAMQVDRAAPAGLFSLPGLPPPNGATRERGSGTALLLHTSGTTSRPKLVPLTWSNLRASAANISDTLRLTPSDRCLNVMPLFHIHGLIAAVLSTIRAGGSVVCTPGLVVPSFFDWMDEFAPTWYSAVPTMHQSILARAPKHPDSLRRSRLRFARSSSAPLPVAVLQELEATFGVPVLEAYGMTEAAHQMTSNPLPPLMRKAGSVGQAAGPDVTVLGPGGAPAAIGEEGDVCIRGTNVTPGYLENVTANEESFRNGWFYTGDLGRIDADGFLFLTGRSKEIVNRGGEKISPREVDEILMTHPAVRQCLTFALPDSQLGEEVGAVVVPRDDVPVDEAELQHFVAARLADFKVPRRVFFLDEIPAGPTGKLQRIGFAGRLGMTEDSWKPKPDAPVTADANVTTAVAGMIAGVLGLPGVDPEVGFFDAGGDSLLAARLLVRLERRFGKTLTMVDLFRAASARAIAAKLATLPAVGTVSAAPKVADGAPTLSAGQVQLWLHDQYDDDNLASQTLRLFEIPGSVSADRVRQALVHIVERHEPLRTVIRMDGGVPRGQLRSVEPLPWAIHDWTTTPAVRREAGAREVCLREAARPFQLDSDLMLRASLHKLGDDRWWLVVLVHHVASDGWSWQVLRRELQACLAGEALPPLTASYSDFARWQETTIAGDRLAALTTYWTAQLEGQPPLLELPLAHPRPARQTYHGRWVRAVFPPSLAAGLRDLGRARASTMFMTLLAGWTCLLGRYSGSSDISVGTPTAGRGQAEFEDLIGLFMNTLVLRTRLAGDPTFHDVLARVRDTCVGAWDHDLPFEYLKQALPPERNLAHSPYFQAHFQLRNFPRAAASTVVPVTEVELKFDAVMTDLNLEITETPSGLQCRLAYNTALFTDRFAQAMLAHFEALLRGAVLEPDTCVWRLPIMDADERATLVSRRLPPQRPRTETTVVELFERQAAERSGEVAILHRDRRVTYRDLNRQSNRLARVLTAAGVGPECVVALCMDRSPEWITAMLAVGKAGGAYLGLEADYPPALLQDLIVRSRTKLIIADERCRERLRGVSAPVIWTAEWPMPADGDDENPPLVARPDTLAHVFFTSGSTGRPKGIATEHRHLCAYLSGYHWMPYSASDTCLQFTSVTFDPSAAEVWGPLTRGGRCAVFGEGLDDPAQLSEWIRGTGATMCYLSASVFNTLIDLAPDALRPMRRILIGGEALSAPHIRRGLDLLPRTELINGYGPTETTLYCTGYRIPRPFDPGRASVPIGRPIDNSCAYVVDGSGQLVPDGLPGELWIGGDTVGRGYLHEPELTAAAFTTSPVPGDDRSRVYHTGDRARWLPDGELEFLGRLDHQVKVRGVRIELGEIEVVLREHPAVRHAVVIAVPHPVAGNTLTGFVELQDDASAPATELRAFLAGRLPNHMVPARLEIRQALPLTASGKIDRQVLTGWASQDHQPPEPARKPAPIAHASERRATPASFDIQNELAGIWRELLGVRDIAANDDFFALGGHSLLAVRMAFQIERQFGRRVTLVSLFEAPTLSRMAELIGGPGAANEVTLPAPVWSRDTVTPMLCIGAGPLFRPLADALAPRCRFHSVPAPVLGARAGIATMEDLAARMVPSIIESHPAGPVMLAGWSLAGVVAIEVAAQLERAGKDVSTVVLFDTLSPVRHRQWFSSSPLIRQWQLNFVKVQYHFEEAVTRGAAGAVRYLMTTLRDARARTQYDRQLREAAAGKTVAADVPLDFRHAFGLYAVSYSPAPLRARILMVRPERHKRGALFSGDLGWSELGYRVDVLIVPGDHEKMFAPANATVLADRLLETIGQANGSVSLERPEPSLAHGGETQLHPLGEPHTGSY